VPEVANNEPVPLRACPDCGVALRDEQQEICVECGSAAPARKPHRARRAAPPVAVALFGTLMAASAAYGLTANLGGSTPAPKQQVAAATPTPTPRPAATTTPAPTPPAAATPAPTPTTPSPPAGNPAPAPASPSPKSHAPATTPSTPSPSPSPGPTTTSTPPAQHSGDGSTSKPARHHSHSHSHSPAGPAWLSQGDQPYSATLYDPYANGTDEHAGAAPKAVDGKAKTAWTTGDHPGGLGKPGVGLVVETGGYQGYSALGVQTATPGFRVEVYSTQAADPPAGGPSNGWKLEATKAGVAKQQRIALKGASAQPTYLLIWITALPAGKPRASLGEITLLP
jgi:hypothetical protein